jgi:hypothetical protein
MLDYINNYISNLTFIHKIQLLLIPIFIVIFIIYNIPQNISKNINTKLSNNSFYDIQLNKLKTKLKDINSIDILKDIQTFSNTLNISILDINIENRYFYMKLEGGFISMIKFLDYSENYKQISKIEDISINMFDDNNMSLDMRLSFANVLRTNKYENININYSINPFIINPNENKKLRINAILNNEVLINTKWYKQGDIISNHKIIKINRHNIHLEKNSKLIILDIFD